MDVGVKIEEGEEGVKVEFIDSEGEEENVKVELVDPDEGKETVVVSNADVKLEILEEELEEKLYSCDVCKKKFIIRALWTSHMKNNHQNNDYPYSCSECGQKFRRKEFLDMHKSNCSMLIKPSKKSIRIYKCSTCFKDFTDLQKKNTHQKQCGSWCELCSKYLSSRREFQRHILAKHPEKYITKNKNTELRFSCDICHRKFRRPVEVRNHRQKCIVDSRTNSYPCKICNRSFLSRAGLAGHLGHHKKESQAGKEYFQFCTKEEAV